MALKQVPGQASAWVLASVVALVVMLISIWNLRKFRRGSYSNFDVSEREQRQSFYPVLLGLLSIATATMFWQEQTEPVRYGMLAAWLMLGVCYGVNFWLKVSLHAAVSFFLACAVWSLSTGWGALAFGLAAVVAASRLVLQRHTLAELVVGAGLGLLAGNALVLTLT